MSTLPSPELLDTVRRAVDARLAPTDDLDRELLVTLCHDAVTFSWILSRRLPDGHVGQRARSAASLLLALGFPTMRAGLRRRLSVACEIVAMGGQPQADD